MSECVKCGINNSLAPIHEHHKNGNHDDNHQENKILLCANCHMTLHWKKWKLSDIGLEDVEIKFTHKKSFESKIERIYKIQEEFIREMNYVKQENQLLKDELEEYKTFADAKILHLTSMINFIVKLTGRYNYTLEAEAKEFVNKYYCASSLPKTIIDHYTTPPIGQMADTATNKEMI